MKRLNLLLWLLLLSMTSFSQIQHIKIVSFTVKNQLPATVDNWNSIPGALLLVAQKAPTARLEGIRLVLQIKSNGAIICGTNPSTGMTVDNFTTRTFQAGELTSMLGGCHDLKEGNYMLCAQFFNIDKVAVSDEACKPFIIEPQKEIEYNPPTLITPENEKIFSSGDMQKPVMFRWTPLVPKPRDPVTYRLRVWQLMQGQTATQALRTNQPIVTKDVDNITQAVVTNIYTGPCRPPYLCDFVWNIQAVNKERKPIGRNNGTSEPWTFKVKEEEAVYTIRNQSPEDKKQFAPEQAKTAISFRWTSLVPKPAEQVTYRLKVWQLMQGQTGSQAMKTNPPVITKDIADITEATVSNIYTGPCRPPYLCDYIWIVEATMQSAAGTAPRVVATSEATVFSVTGNETAGSLSNVLPEDKKQLAPEQAKAPITFRWTSLVPKPSGLVTYRLKVWQLMQGQSGIQAMKTNQPIVTKEVDNVTETTVSGIYTGPCRPPYLCDFIWVVEARIKNAAGISEPVATSSPYTINIGLESTDDTSIIEGRLTINNSFPENKREFIPDEIKQSVRFRWTPLVPKPRESITYRLKVWQLMQGQSGSQAMKTNQPIATKDVANITEATITNIYTGPCRPPYLCDYIWIVEATVQSAAGTAPRVVATSQATVFSVNGNEAPVSLNNFYPEDKKQFFPEQAKMPITFRWTPLAPKSSGPVTYRMKVWQLMQGQNGSQAMKSNQPIVTKDVDNLTEVTISNIYTGPCRPPYLCDYIWNVEAIGRSNAGTPPKSIATSIATTFSVTGNEIEGSLSNVFPEDKKQMAPELAKSPITFRWTPLVPKPQGPVTYRLKVWQLMQGQTGAMAMQGNQPIVTRDVHNITEATVNNIYTGPCRPPYLCDYIWVVEATMNNAAGTPPRVVATSEATTFSVTGNEIQASLSNVFPEDKKAFTSEEMKTPVNFRWTPLTPKPSAPVTYRLKVWQLMQGQNGSQAMKSNQPIFTKDLDNVTETTSSTIYTGPCKPPYLCDFIWVVEATEKNAAGTVPRVIATSQATTFSVTEHEVKATLSNVYPEDKKQFTPEQVKTPVTFRWTTLTPKPSEPVTYRLKVWQLMQGQSGTQAMKSNHPIVTKDVDNITEATVSNIYTGPCKPPYLCDFIWNVEALSRSAAGTAPKIIASSAPTMFAVTQYIIQIDSIKVQCTAKPGVYSFSYSITNPNAGPATLNLFTVTSSVPAGATISSFTPPINTTIGPGNQLNITGTINAAVNLSNICIGAEIKDVGNAFWKASKDTCINVGPCKCDACDSVKIDVTQKDIKFDANGNIVLSTSMTIGPKPVKSIKAELVYYEYKPESDDCMLCNKDSKTFGNFDSGNLDNTNGIGAGTHSMAWNFSPPKNLTGGTGASMVITVPPTVKCCDAVIRWCIRYVVTFDDCTVCNKLICYEKKKEGCAKGNPNPNNDQK